MNKKYLWMIPAMALFTACGGEEEESNSESENATTNEETTAEYHTSFGTCDVSNSEMSMTQDSLDDSYAFALEGLQGVDLSSFTTVTAELTEKHNTLYIKFVNNPAISDAKVRSYGPDDMSMTLFIKAKEGELSAGEFTEEDHKIRLTKGMKEGNTSKSKDLGSNKTPKSIIINDLSEDHICGSFMMTTEEGAELVSASFDADVKVVKF